MTCFGSLSLIQATVPVILLGGLPEIQAEPPIPKPRNTDGAIEDLGILITAAYGLDTTWMEVGSCYNWGSNRPGHPTPWQVAPGKKYNGISGSELQKYALMICSSCDAQYDCADYAVDAKMIAGSWAMPITQLRWLQCQDDAHDLIEMARANDVPVQVVASHSMDVCQLSDQSSTTSM